MKEIKKALTEALEKTKDLHKLDEKEIMLLAVLVSTVATSDKKTRSFFHTEVHKIVLKIKEMLDKQAKTALKNIIKLNKDDDKILN